MTKENYLKRNDEELGAMVRVIAHRLKDEEWFESCCFAVATKLMVGALIRSNSDNTVINIEGFDWSGVDHGSWEVIVRKKEK